MISAEALFNGSRWRLQVKDDGTWEVASREGRDWAYPALAGNDGLAGVREAAAHFEPIDAMCAAPWFGGLLKGLADVAESGRAA